MKKLKHNKYVYDSYKGSYVGSLNTKQHAIMEIEHINKNIYKCTSVSLNFNAPGKIEFLTQGQISERIRLGIIKPTDDAGIALLLLSD